MRIKLYSIRSLILILALLSILATCTVLKQTDEIESSDQDLNSGLDEGFDKEFGAEVDFSEKTSTISPKEIALEPLSDWQSREFAGKTVYTLTEDEGDIAIKAESQGTASMLIKQKKVDLNKTPWVNWQWKVDTSLINDQETLKHGDDFAARIYIAVSPKTGSLYPRALNYVWSSAEPLDSHWPNPYAGSVIMVSVEQGKQFNGQWRSQKRNLKEDLKQFFDEDIEQIQGIAIMTDTDNTGQSATAWYKSIYFSEE